MLTIERVVRTKDGKIKLYTPNGGPAYTFWSETEFREFAARNLAIKPRDVPLQEAVKAVLRVAPSLDAAHLATIRDATPETLTRLADPGVR